MMSDSRARLFNPHDLVTLFQVGGVAAILAVCRQFPDDATVCLIESALTMSAAQLKDHPDALPMLLYARLHAHINNPDVAALRQALRPYLDFIPVQEPTHFQAGGAILSKFYGITDKIEELFTASEQSKEKSIRPDGTFLALDENNQVWRENEQYIAHLKVESCYGILWMPDDRFLTWGKRLFYLWSRDGQLIAILEHVLPLEQPTIDANASVMPDGRIITWSGDNTIRLWTSDGQALLCLHREEFYLCDVAILSNNRIAARYATHAPSVEIFIWDLPDKAICNPVSYTHFHAFWPLSDGRIASSTYDGDVSVWSKNGDLETYISGYHEPIEGLRLLDGGHLLIWSHYNFTGLRSYAPTGQEIPIGEQQARDWELSFHNQFDYGSYKPKEPTILYYTDYSLTFDYQSLRLYHTESEVLHTTYPTDSPIVDIHLLGRDRLAIGCHNGQIIFLDLPTPT